METKLLPCPFCGGKAKFDRNGYDMLLSLLLANDKDGLIAPYLTLDARTKLFALYSQTFEDKNVVSERREVE